MTNWPNCIRHLSTVRLVSLIAHSWSCLDKESVHSDSNSSNKSDRLRRVMWWSADDKSQVMSWSRDRKLSPRWQCRSWPRTKSSHKSGALSTRSLEKPSSRSLSWSKPSSVGMWFSLQSNTCYDVTSLMWIQILSHKTAVDLFHHDRSGNF